MAAMEKYSALGTVLIAAMQEAVAYARGEIELPTPVAAVPVGVPKAVDIAATRKR